MKKIYVNHYAPTLHGMYRIMTSYPPVGYQYVLKDNGLQIDSKVSKKVVSKVYDINKISWFWNFNKNILSRYINTVKIKDFLYPIFVIPKKGIDIIYSTGYIVKWQKKPWILDMEVLHVLNGYDIVDLQKHKKYYTKQLESPGCKAIIVWNSNIYKSIDSFFGSEIIKNKTHIIRQTIPASGYIKKIFPETSVRFLFLGSGNILTASYVRGIKDALLIYKELTKKYKGISLTIAPFLPDELKEEFGSLAGLKSMDKLLNQAEMKELYKNSDILLHPSYSHPAMTLVEAMNYGLSILTTNYAGVDDLIKDSYNGLICRNNNLFEYYDPYYMVRHDLGQQVMKYSGNDSKMIQDFVDKAVKLIENIDLRKRLAIGSKETIESGEYNFEYNNLKRKELFDNII